jgi:putative membrane protein
MQLDRRTALLGLAAASAAIPLIITPAQAQTQPAASGQDAADYVQKTLMIGTVAMKTSEIATQKGTDENVKKFANLEVAEQKTIASVLAATPNGKQPPELPPDMQKQIDDLNAMQPGPEFDQAYVEGQISGHNDLLAVQKTLSGESEASVEAITARLAEQGVASHIAMLQLIQQMLGAQNIQNIQDGKNPDGSTAPAQGGDQPAAPATNDQQTPAEGTAPASNGG